MSEDAGERYNGFSVFKAEMLIVDHKLLPVLKMSVIYLASELLFLAKTCF